jgi:hypothetical protein
MTHDDDDESNSDVQHSIQGTTTTSSSDIHALLQSLPNHFLEAVLFLFLALFRKMNHESGYGICHDGTVALKASALEVGTTSISAKLLC